ncbi:glycosyltransferase family 2 protein [Desulfuromonas sp. AOP6]|uniref:glycosyltransferase family 2 protein n=1 Tax=Desulfuromonas sp. AOP6 TaxID=1566351 RepID=UPI00127BBB5D|nr:glycosyltransferase family 2 protein [Desulfuromonas sp. AOP6]BCA80110.1 glycosyl transferase [Desulfuromonas sp. AOP6]
MDKATISVVMIVKNEESKIESCLRSLSWADELIILDSGSTDLTVEICRKYTKNVYIENVWHGFGAQRQLAESYASGDWIFAIDGDEEVTEKLSKEIQGVVETDARDKVYAVPRLTWAFGSFVRHSGWYPDYVVRLYPRKRAQYNDAVVHERVIFGSDMNLHYLKNDLLHYSYTNLESWVAKSARYSALWAEAKHAEGVRCTFADSITHSIMFFLRVYVVKRGFLDGAAGFMVAATGAFSRFLKYSDLWLRQKNRV